jgi:DNA-binding CsgD family transcriptional regulator
MARRLARREKQVLRLFGAGYQPEDIARQVGISEGTVVWIVGNIVGEIGARSTAQLAKSLAPRRWSPEPIARLLLPAAGLGIALLLSAAALARTGMLHVPAVPFATSSTGPSATSSPGPPSSAPATTATAVPNDLGPAVPSDRSPGSVPSGQGSAVPAVVPPPFNQLIATPPGRTAPPVAPTPPAPTLPVVPTPPLTVPPAPSLPLPLPTLPPPPSIRLP